MYATRVTELFSPRLPIVRFEFPILETIPEMTAELATVLRYVNSMSLSSRGVIFLPVREGGWRKPAKISSFFLPLSFSFSMCLRIRVAFLCGSEFATLSAPAEDVDDRPACR